MLCIWEIKLALFDERKQVKLWKYQELFYLDNYF